MKEWKKLSQLTERNGILYIKKEADKPKKTYRESEFSKNLREEAEFNLTNPRLVYVTGSAINLG